MFTCSPLTAIGDGVCDTPSVAGYYYNCDRAKDMSSGQLLLPTLAAHDAPWVRLTHPADPPG